MRDLTYFTVKIYDVGLSLPRQNHHRRTSILSQVQSSLTSLDMTATQGKTFFHERHVFMSVVPMITVIYFIEWFSRKRHLNGFAILMTDSRQRSVKRIAPDVHPWLCWDAFGEVGFAHDAVALLDGEDTTFAP